MPQKKCENKHLTYYIIHDSLNRTLYGSHFYDKFRAEKTNKIAPNFVPTSTATHILFLLLSLNCMKRATNSNIKSLEQGPQQRLDVSVRRCS